MLLIGHVFTIKANCAESYDLKEVIKPSLRGVNKPAAVILFHPLDGEGDGATKLKSNFELIEAKGYSVLNKITKKRPVILDEDLIKNKDKFFNPSKLSQAIRREVTVNLFLIGHGAPGWFFSNEGPANEAEIAIETADYIYKLEEKLNIKFTHIVLNACFSATEIDEPTTGNYFNSPARLLSYRMPDKFVIGFLGSFADARVNAYTKNNEVSPFLPKAFSLIQASIVFKEGKAINFNRDPIYINGQYIPDFLDMTLFTLPTGTDDFFLQKSNLSALEKSEDYTLNSSIFGDRQITTIKQ